MKKEAKEDVCGFSPFRNGNNWMIGPHGREKSFKHIKGYDFVRFLIEDPNREISARQVYHLGKIDPGAPVEYARQEKTIDPW